MKFYKLITASLLGFSRSSLLCNWRRFRVGFTRSNSDQNIEVKDSGNFAYILSCGCVSKRDFGSSKKCLYEVVSKYDIQKC